MIWELQPQLQYSITDNIAVRVGYRRLHYKYENDRDNEFDGEFSGFIIGLGITF